MNLSVCVTNKAETISLIVVRVTLAINLFLLMMSAANTSAHAQTSNDVSNSAASATSSPADWTQFHRNNMQRWNPYETVLGVGNVGSLQVKWKSATGFYQGAPVSSPAVVNGVVYVGSDDGNVYALNASTGAKLWSSATEQPVYSSPAVADGVVYVSSNDGDVYALNAGTGATLWTYTTQNFLDSSLTVGNGIVYVGAADNNVYALSASSGALLWSYATQGSVESSPALVNGVLYVGSDDGNVYALNARTGALLWSSITAYDVMSSPAVANGKVYVGSEDFNVYALNASTGAKLWSYTTNGAVISSPAVANGIVYVGSEDFNVYALNASTGAVMWSYTAESGFFSSPAVANGVVYIGSDDGTIYALNANTGARLWSYLAGNNGSCSPSVVNGILYVTTANGPSDDGHVYAFAPASADLFLRLNASSEPIPQGSLLTYTFPIWNLGPNNADQEVLTTQVPEGTTFDSIRISGTPGLGTCTTPPYQGTGQIVCHENSAMSPNTTWTVQLTVKVTAPVGTLITESGTVREDTPDPNPANNTATVSTLVE